MVTFSKIREYNLIENISQVDKDNILFLGKALDDRGEGINTFLKSKYTNNIQIEYENETDSFIVHPDKMESKIIKRYEIEQLLQDIVNSNVNVVAFEATTLGYCEILLILYAINMLKFKVTIKIYYAEPDRYRSRMDNEEYELSEEYSNHKYIKPFILEMPHDSTLDQKATLVSLLGFEDNRMGRVINDNENKYDQFISIFPIPGFQFGWENISLSKHHVFLDNKDDIYYTPADNPYETYKLLNKITTNLNEKRIIIMPIGTKPCTIGTAIFLINAKEQGKNQIATKYDFPIKKHGRSIGIAKIYEYILHIS